MVTVSCPLGLTTQCFGTIKLILHWQIEELIGSVSPHVYGQHGRVSNCKLQNLSYKQLVFIQYRNLFYRLIKM